MTITSTPSGLCGCGEQLLAEKQFAAAAMCFSRAVELAPDTAAAHWGLLLARRQCTEESELYARLAVPIDGDEEYRAALRYADAAQRERWCLIAGLTLLSCHKKVLGHALDGDAFLAGEWAAHYAAAPAEDKPFAEESRLLADAAKNGGVDVRLMLRIYGRYAEYDGGRENSDLAPLKLMIALRYAGQMAGLLETILRAPGRYTSAQLDGWADPAAGAAAAIGLDGNSDDVGERYAFLAEKLIGTGDTSAAAIGAVAHCYRQAAAHAPERDYAAALARFFDRTAARDAATTAELAAIVSLSPGVARYLHRYIALYFAQKDAMLPSCAADDEHRAFLQKPRNGYTRDEADAQIERQKARLAASDAAFDRIRRDTLPYAEKALAAGTAEEREAFRREWEERTARLQAQKRENADTVAGLIAQIENKVRQDDEKGRASARAKGIMFSLLSVIVVSLSVFAAVPILRTLRPTTALLTRPVVQTYWLIFAVVFAAWLVQTIAVGIFDRRIGRAGKYHVAAGFRAVTRTVRVLTALFLPAAAGLLIYSFVVFPQNLGQIAVTDVDGLRLMAYAPSCTFSLEADLDLDGAALGMLGKFKGTFLGNGHAISHFALTDDGCLIETNRGEIRDLRLISPALAERSYIVADNRGTLDGIVLSGVVLRENGTFLGIAGKNSGTLIRCTVMDVTGEGSYFAGMCSSNVGRIEACHVKGVDIKAERAVGFVWKVEGSVVGCSFSGKLETKIEAFAFADVLRHKDAVIERCSATGSLTGGWLVSGFLYDLSEGRLENCFSTVNIVQRCTENTDAAGGLVCQLYLDREADEALAVIRKCYFGGSIKIVPGDNGGEYEVVGGLISNTWAESGLCLIEDSFSVGTIDVSRVKKHDLYLYGPPTVTVRNTYLAYKEDIAVVDLDGEPEVKKKSAILKTAFITETLGWDSEIWTVANGKLPTLKEYTPQQ